MDNLRWHILDNIIIGLNRNGTIMVLIKDGKLINETDILKIGDIYKKPYTWDFLESNLQDFIYDNAMMNGNSIVSIGYKGIIRRDDPWNYDATYFTVGYIDGSNFIKYTDIYTEIKDISIYNKDIYISVNFNTSMITIGDKTYRFDNINDEFYEFVPNLIFNIKQSLCNL